MESVGTILEALKGYGGYTTTLAVLASAVAIWWKGLPVIIQAIGGRDSQLRDHYDREILSLERRMGEMQAQADRRFVECQKENDALRHEARVRETSLIKTIDDLRVQIGNMQRSFVQAEISAVRENLEVPELIRNAADRAAKALDREV